MPLSRTCCACDVFMHLPYSVQLIELWSTSTWKSEMLSSETVAVILTMLTWVYLEYGCWNDVCVCSFSALMLLGGRQEGHLTCKKSCHNSVSGSSYQHGGSMLSPVRNTVIRQCFDVVVWVIGMASAASNSIVTTVPSRLLLGTSLTWPLVTLENGLNELVK